MKTTELLAKHFREVHFGGNWTAVNLRDQLAGLNWEQAVTPVGTLNSIAVLVYHMNYYVRAATRVLKGGKLEAKDAYSFNMPPIKSEKDWEELKTAIFNEAATFADLVGDFPEERLWNTFEDEKYGTYYRNFLGIIEHCHYHLGQITLIRKMLLQQGTVVSPGPAE